ncbi:MAG: putative membrane protein YfcA [Cryomorphaceae bacterium]|jgi:uncharacterized membrane protein YfcA
MAIIMDISLIPESVGLCSFALLIGLSCLTSMLTASIGIGGGTVLLAVMAQLVPVKAIIPVHGVVQLGSNFGRAAIMAPQLNKPLVLWFALGSIIGAAVGGQIVVSLPIVTLQAMLGAFILFSVWGPKLNSSGGNSASLLGGGFLSTLLTMFVGATGPFVLAILRAFSLPPQTLVATSAACLVIQHMLKVLVFGLLGFAYAPYIWMIGLMVASGFIGTVLGRKVLIKTDPAKFQRALNWVLTLLALRLIFQAVF